MQYMCSLSRNIAPALLPSINLGPNGSGWLVRRIITIIPPPAPMEAAAVGTDDATTHKGRKLLELQTLWVLEQGNARV